MPDGAYGVKKTTWLGWIGSHLFVAFFCVGFPGFCTAVAPVSWVKFQRTGDRVSARAQVCVFFVIPYKTLVVDSVESIGDRFKGGTESRQRRSGTTDRVTKSEDQGFLVIHGADQVAEVPVTPFNLKSVVKRSEAFLKEPQATELKMFVVANWKFSVIMGGLTSLLTVLWVFGVVSSFFLMIYKSLRGTLRFATGTNLRAAESEEGRGENESSGFGSERGNTD